LFKVDGLAIVGCAMYRNKDLWPDRPRQAVLDI